MSQESETSLVVPPIEAVAPYKESDLLIANRLGIISTFYGVSIEEMLDERRTIRLVRARKVAAYTLHESLGIKFAGIANALDRTWPTVRGNALRLANEMEADRLLAMEVAYLGKAKRISQSIDQRIVTRVSEATGIDRALVLAPDSAETREARDIAIALTAERGHAAPQEIAQLFGLSAFEKVYRVRRLMRYKEPINPLLGQQMDWVRQKVLTEKPAIFAFQDVSKPVKDKKSQNDLPEIDPNLVHPNIVEAIYNTVVDVATFYNLPPDAIIGRGVEFLHTRARGAALVICEDLKIPHDELALCFDGRSPISLKQFISRVRGRLANDEVFRNELENIIEGEKRLDIAQETLKRVSLYYDLPINKLKSKKGKYGATWESRAKSVYLAVMARQGSIPQHVFAQKVGKSETNAHSTISNTLKRAANNPRLKAEIEYLSDPHNNPRPFTPQDLIDYVVNRMGTTIKDLKEGRTLKDIKLRRATAYILATEAELPRENISQLLGISVGATHEAVKTIRREVKCDPAMALRIDVLLPAEAISRQTVNNGLTRAA